MIEDQKPVPVKVWESEGKAGNGEAFLSVHRLGHYYYSQRPGIDSVAFILVDGYDVGVLDIYHGPTLDVRECAFTGSLDVDGMSLIETVIAETKEEAGYVVTTNDIEFCGTFEVGTQTNEMVHLYLVDVQGKTQGEREPDGPHEAASKVVWKHRLDVMRKCRDLKAVLLAQKVDDRFELSLKLSQEKSPI